MSKKVLAVFDGDIGYVDRFLRYMKSKRNLPFKTVGFSSMNSMELFLERNTIDILLLSEPFLTEAEKEKLYAHPSIGEVLLSGEEEDLLARRKKIRRYRPAEDLLADVIQSCRLDYEENPSDIGFVPGIVCVYSPDCMMERQLFAQAAAAAFAVTKSVLYVNFERFSGLKTNRAASDPSFSDLIYYFKTNQKRFRECLAKAVIRQADYDLLPAPNDQEDFDLIEEAEWNPFFHLLADCGSYDVIVLDPAEAVRKPEVLFSLCEKVFVPVTGSRQGLERCAEMRTYLLEKEGERFLERFTEVPATAEPEDTEEKEVREERLKQEIRKIAEKACFEYERGKR